LVNGFNAASCADKNLKQSKKSYIFQFKPKACLSSESNTKKMFVPNESGKGLSFPQK